MKQRSVHILDADRAVLAAATVEQKGELYLGSVDLSATPARAMDLFREFEEIVNGQEFSVVDDLQDRIDAFGPRAAFEGGEEFEIHDLQVYPSEGNLSFRRGTEAQRPAASAHHHANGHPAPSGTRQPADA